MQVAGNVVGAMGLFAEDQGLVKAVVNLIARLSFADPSLNLTQIVGDVQVELCKVRMLGPLLTIGRGLRAGCGCGQLVTALGGRLWLRGRGRGL
jgi:hypothetical protein